MIIKHPRLGGVRFDLLKRAIDGNLSVLYYCFPWGRSKEGHRYWRAVWDSKSDSVEVRTKLLEIAEECSKCLSSGII